MKKFVILTYGFTPPTDEVQRAWGEWFKSAGPRLVDPGSPFGRGVEVTRDSRTELSLQSPSPLTGYCIPSRKISTRRFGSLPRLREPRL